MGHLRIRLSPEAYERLRELSQRTGRAAWIEASILLEGVLNGLQPDEAAGATFQSIRTRTAEIRRSVDQ